QKARFVTTIHQESLRLTGLLDEILDLSALERGERSWENAPVDPDAALDRAVDVCAPLMRQRGMRLSFGERAAGAMVTGEAGRLAQVLISLLINAAKYNDAADPEVKVSTRITGGDFTIEIADNGPGIDESEHGLIFEKF